MAKIIMANKQQKSTTFFLKMFSGIFLLAATSLSPLFAQTTTAPGKIDPVFRYMLTQGKSAATNEAGAYRSHLKVKPTEGFAARNMVSEKRYECVVYTRNPKELQDSGIVVNSVLPGFVTAWVTLDQITRMSLISSVDYIKAPAIMRIKNDVVSGTSGASLLHQGRLNNTVYKGKNVIVAIFDSGIDWKHLDFRNPADTTKSRILRIWDQTLTATTGETRPSGFSYGVEYTQAQINNELNGSPANFVRERDTDGHGTHVTGTAAGNGASLPSKKYEGMAPEADLIIIKGGDSTFSSTREIDALTYLKALSTQLGKPVVVNMSIGSEYSPHDGTLPEEVAIDDFTASASGRSVVVAAANENGLNIHNRFTLAGNASNKVTFTVPAGSGGSYVFDYLIYANSNSSISAAVAAPNNGGTVTATAGQSRSGAVLNNGFTVYVDNLTDPANNDRYVEVDIERNGSGTTSPGGTWSLTLTNNTSAALTMDGWLDDVDNAFSSTALTGGDDNYVVGSPGNATSAITAASYVGKNNWYSDAQSVGHTYGARQDSISSFSSRGPRRDGVLKPEIAADGEVVASCLSSSATTFSSPFIAKVGLYAVASGTSMAAPNVTGAVALLMQTHPSATAAQLKSYITSAAAKDAMTELPGLTPNTTWGYGKLDVFKAASAAFNCMPADRKTYKYDSSTVNAQEAGTTFTSQRVAVRFAPDISGKLGGLFFHTSIAAAGLFAEVRTNSGGVPGSLLGTLNIDSNAIARYTFNYVDLSGLNVNVTSGTDYFVVIGHTGNGSWSLRGDALAISGRSFLSNNNGATWIVENVNYKVRSVVYSNGEVYSTLATASSADTRNISTSNQFINAACQLISRLVPGGTSPAVDTITGKVWIESAVPHYKNSPYVQRHYETLPKTSAATATGNVTLYFTQAEFTAFNNDASSILDLPANPNDTAGKANLRIGKYAGISADNSGLPATYSGSSSVIDPADGDIVWNAEASRWEVSFSTTGFGGFIVQTSAYVLPVTIEYFKGNIVGVANVLSWKVNCTGAQAFSVERSVDGVNFTAIGSLISAAGNCSNPFNFTDAAPLPGANYYRIKVTESNSNILFTGIVLLQNSKPSITRLYPNIIAKGGSVQVQFAGTKGILNIMDAAGKQLLAQTITNGTQSIYLPIANPGLYFYVIKQDKKTIATGKIVVQ